MKKLSESYRELVEKLARERTGEPVFNTSLDHAAVLVETMFAHASQSVDILSGNLNARVYGPASVLAQARLFLADPSHSVRILVEDADEVDVNDHPFLAEFLEDQSVHLRHVPQEWQEQYKFHFLVMDKDSYRFEKDKSAPVAVAAFGDKSGAANLAELFDKLWGVSTPIHAKQREKELA